jgi:hypothetical protein
MEGEYDEVDKFCCVSQSCRDMEDDDEDVVVVVVVVVGMARKSIDTNETLRGVKVLASRTLAHRNSIRATSCQVLKK